MAVNFNIAKKHIYTIDIIRAISAILIVLYHFTSRYNDNEYIILTNATTHWNFSVSWGYGAVCSFFILSGFLLAKYFAVDNNSQRVLCNRLCRLYPTFWVCMTITSIVLILTFPETKITLTQYFVNLTMMPSLFGIRYIDGAYWTMACEIMFAFIYFTIIKFKNIRIRKLLLILVLMMSIVESLFSYSDNIAFKILRVFFISDQIQLFIIGLCVFYILNRKGDRYYYYIFIICCIIQFLQNYSLIHNIFFSTTVLLLILSPYIDAFVDTNALWYKIIEYIARISYPLYLLHQMIGFAIIKKLQSVGFVNEYWIIIPMILSIFLAGVVHKYIEKPTSRGEFFKRINVIKI